MEGPSKNRGCAVLTMVFIVTYAIVVAGPVNAGQTYSEVVSVSCYKGDPEVGNRVGDLTVPTPENAGQTCNSFYSDCEGQCSGCVSDFDISEDVCYDKSGRKFLIAAD